MTIQQRRANDSRARWAFWAMLLMTSVSFADSNQLLDASLARRLAKLKQQYQAAASIQFKMSSRLTVNDSSDRNPQPIMRGDCAYWASGQNYRMNTTLTPHQGKPNEWIVAYDERRWQLFEQEPSRLIYKKANESRQPTSLPNPILAPLAFVRPLASDNGVKLLWAEAQGEGFWDSLRDMRLVKLEDPDGQGLMAEFRGQSADGQAFSSRIYFGTEPDHLPTRIDYLRDGQVGFRYLIDQYARQVIDGQETHWPKQVRLCILDQQRVAAELAMDIEELKLNAQIPADIFTLDFTSPDIIYDDDLQVFLKTKGGYRVSPTIVAAEGRFQAETSAPALPDDQNQTVNSIKATPTPIGEQALAATTLTEIRGMRLRWAGLFLSLIAVGLTIAYARSRRPGSRNAAAA